MPLWVPALHARKRLAMPVMVQQPELVTSQWTPTQSVMLMARATCARQRVLALPLHHTLVAMLSTLSAMLQQALTYVNVVPLLAQPTIPSTYVEVQMGGRQTVRVGVEEMAQQQHQVLLLAQRAQHHQPA